MADKKKMDQPEPKKPVKSDAEKVVLMLERVLGLSPAVIRAKLGKDKLTEQEQANLVKAYDLVATRDAEFDRSGMQVAIETERIYCARLRDAERQAEQKQEPTEPPTA